jgi:hypothetical protein
MICQICRKLGIPYRSVFTEAQLQALQPGR